MLRFIIGAALMMGLSGYVQANPLNDNAKAGAKNSGYAAKKTCLAKDPKMRGEALRKCMNAEKAKK